MENTVIQLGNGVEGLFIKNDRFNSTLISFHFYIPLEADTISKNALLPYLLTSCSKEYKDYIALNTRLLELYGANLSAAAGKSGDNLHIRISLNLINDELTFEKENLVEKGADLLFSMIFDPSVEAGSFMPADTAREKRKTTERIEGEINNKRSYARTRLIAEMFGSDPYGLFVYGKADEVERLTGEELYEAWKQLLKCSYVRLNIIGKTLPEGIFDKMKERFLTVGREDVADICKTALLPETKEVRTITERFAVTQGKLVMGYTSDKIESEIESLPYLLCADIFGGGPYSKLFTNVREKQSLCYYCSAAAVRQKGFMTVDSGIDAANADKVIEAVGKELGDMQSGNFEDFSIESSKRAICDTLYSYYDSAAALDAWYCKGTGSGKLVTLEQTIDAINKITKEQIVNAAKSYKLHTVYKLLPEGSED